MISSIIYDFVGKCDSVGITPSEKEIDAYLRSINKTKYREQLIKFCFYHWDYRNQTEFIDEMLNTIE